MDAVRSGSSTVCAVRPIPQRWAGRHTFLRLTTAMFDATDEREVVWAAMGAIAVTGPFAAEAAYADHHGVAQRCRPCSAAGSGHSRPGIVAVNATAAEPAEADDDPTATDGVDRWIGALDGRSGRWDSQDGHYLWALALRHRGRCLGYLVVRILDTPSTEETADAELLARQAAAALAGLSRPWERPARAEREQWPTAEEPGPGVDLGATVSALSYQNAFHRALTRVGASGKGELGMLQALHDHTGFSALTEDPFGNLRAWAGPGRGGPRPGSANRPRDELLRQVRRRQGAVRDRNCLVVPIEAEGDLLGLVALVDPDRRAGKLDTAALEETGLALAPELSHERALAELEPRLRHDLVERLISGEATDGVFVHAAALGHDLHGPHRIAVLQWDGPTEEVTLGDAVARAAERLGLDVLIGARETTTVVLVAGPDPGDALYRAVAQDLGTVAGAVGIGSRCDLFTELPHSYDEAVRALTVRRRSPKPHGSTSFEEIGICRMMGTGDGERETDRFVREWLGALLEYDARHHTDMVTTLSHYLESGGSYDTTADVLQIHRSTVRYRLRRIREITDHDLSDVETRLNLHVATRIRNVLGRPGTARTSSRQTSP
ncbi:helix-turn-helix domain-containing protein [Streptomyces sp. NPDC051020]|uniref:PucR family transcriptional regulator n=1 Tax=Streptomyces sp. NPDC051020 TaxID=3155409 RepID=UPI00342D0592